jgi:TRAP-type transport system periplasmic protein
LTAVGLSDIEPGVGGLQNIPMIFRSLEEFEKVTERLRPTLEKRMAEKGFTVLFWVDAGWVHHFSKEPLITPEDLKRMKIFAWAGSPEQISIMRHAGYTAVPLETADILPALQTGMITVAPLPPIFALAAQVDLRAPHMLDVNWAPLVGACVVKKDVWEKIPTESREPLMTAAARAGTEIRQGSRKESVDAVEAMKKRGLKVHEPTPDEVELWRKEAEKIYPEIRGSPTIVPADIFDQVKQQVEIYRSSAEKK